jgi:hypothetical protein
MDEQFTATLKGSRKNGTEIGAKRGAVGSRGEDVGERLVPVEVGGRADRRGIERSVRAAKVGDSSVR